MAANIFFRLCTNNIKVEGIYTHSRDIFVRAKKPMSIANGIGLTVVRESGKSERICNRATILSHIEHDLTVYWRWKDEYGACHRFLVIIVLNEPIACQGEKPAW